MRPPRPTLKRAYYKGKNLNPPPNKVGPRSGAKFRRKLRGSPDNSPHWRERRGIVKISDGGKTERPMHNRSCNSTKETTPRTRRCRRRRRSGARKPPSSLEAGASRTDAAQYAGPRVGGNCKLASLRYAKFRQYPFGKLTSITYFANLRRELKDKVNPSPRVHEPRIARRSNRAAPLYAEKKSAG